MKIGVMSDIHDNIPNLLVSFDVFKKERVKKVLFCGDLNSPFTIDYFTKLNIPILAIFGNNEGDKISLLRRIENHKLDFQYGLKQGMMVDTRIENKRIGMYHGFQNEILESILDSGNFDLFLSGHTHISHIETHKKTLWVNPGSVCGFVGLDVKQVKPSIAVIELATLDVKLIEL